MICPACRVEYNKGVAPDPCIGRLPGPVVSACCGHGNVDHALVILAGEPKTRLVGADALRYVEQARA